MADRIQIRRDTKANWEDVNPVLAAGEFGFEIDTNKLKCGNGVNAWTALPYVIEADMSLVIERIDKLEERIAKLEEANATA